MYSKFFPSKNGKKSYFVIAIYQPLNLTLTLSLHKKMNRNDQILKIWVYPFCIPLKFNNLDLDITKKC